MTIGDQTTTCAPLLDTGATYSDCPSSLKFVATTRTPFDETRVTEVSEWKHEAFYGPAHHAHSKTLLPQITASRERTDYLLRFPPGKASITLGEVGPLPLKTLTLPGPVTKEEIRPRFQTSTPNPPASRETNVLGRDVLFKLVDMTTKKPRGQSVNVKFEMREDVTPPGSPTRDALDIRQGVVAAVERIGNAGTAAIEVISDKGTSAAQAAARTGEAVALAVTNTGSRVAQAGSDVFASASASFRAALGSRAPQEK